MRSYTPTIWLYLGPDDDHEFGASAEVTLYPGGDYEVGDISIRCETTGDAVDYASWLGDWAGEHGLSRDKAERAIETQLHEAAIEEYIGECEDAEDDYDEDAARGMRGWDD